MHATEGSIPSRLQEQVQPVTVPEEASTSSHRVSHHSVSFPVPPDPVVAGAPAPASSFKLMRILVFGIVLAAVLVLTATLWALQHGQHRATRSSMKGLIARSYDELDCHVSAACPGGGMQHGTSEYGSLPLCPERQLPSWTQTCASCPVQHVKLGSSSPTACAGAVYVLLMSCLTVLETHIPYLLICRTCRLGLVVGYISVVAYLKSRVFQVCHPCLRML